MRADLLHADASPEYFYSRPFFASAFFFLVHARLTEPCRRLPVDTARDFGSEREKVNSAPTGMRNEETCRDPSARASKTNGGRRSHDALDKELEGKWERWKTRKESE